MATLVRVVKAIAGASIGTPVNGLDVPIGALILTFIGGVADNTIGWGFVLAPTGGLMGYIAWMWTAFEEVRGDDGLREGVDGAIFGWSLLGRWITSTFVLAVLIGMVAQRWWTGSEDHMLALAFVVGALLSAALMALLWSAWQR